MTIKAGFQLQITSYTNDGDSYNTTMHDGLSADDVRLVLEIVKPFKSQHCGGKWGNKNVNGDVVDGHVFECFNNHPNIKESAYYQWVDGDDSMDGLSDFVFDLVGADEYCGWRVFESFKVYYIPERLNDLSGNFK